MSDFNIAREHACQQAAGGGITYTEPPITLDRQARLLRERYSFTLERARVIADLAFQTTEARA